MNKEITKLENCLKAMKKCLKIPKVENCICFSDAFKVLITEASGLNNKFSDTESKEKLLSLKKNIEDIQRNISKGNKECLGCSPCMAAVVFKNYPDRLDNLYLDDKL